MPWFTMYAGIHKTGSSAIHSVLTSQRHLLLDQGLLYPESPGGFENHFPYVQLVRPFGKGNVWYSPSQKREIRKKELVRLAQTKLLKDRMSSRAWKSHNVLVAAEQFSGLSSRELHLLFRVLRPYSKGRSARGLIWVRDPVELYRSLALQRLKQDFRLVALNVNPLAGGERFHRTFAQYFQTEPCVFYYDGKTYRSHSIVPDFFDALDPRLTVPHSDGNQFVNRSITAEAGFLMNRILSSQAPESDAVRKFSRMRVIRREVVKLDLAMGERRPSSLLTPETRAAVEYGAKDSWTYFQKALTSAGAKIMPQAGETSGSRQAFESFTNAYSELPDQERIKLLFDIDEGYLTELADQWAFRSGEGRPPLQIDSPQ
jgi:hypothetical protein